MAREVHAHEVAFAVKALYVIPARCRFYRWPSGSVQRFVEITEQGIFLTTFGILVILPISCEKFGESLPFVVCKEEILSVYFREAVERSGKRESFERAPVEGGLVYSFYKIVYRLELPVFVSCSDYCVYHIGADSLDCGKTESDVAFFVYTECAE